MCEVAEVESALFSAFPREAAEEWDRPGLTVGDPHAKVTGIACALDVTPAALAFARERGANLLVTHHPAYLDPPGRMGPDACASSLAGRCVWEAARSGISLVAMHTNLDRSRLALETVSRSLGYPLVARVEEPDGYGAVLDAGDDAVEDVARRCQARLGGSPRVWPAVQARPGLVAYCSGSLGGLGREAISRGCGCVITGECGYHVALDLQLSGCAGILLGHDVSEFPYVGLLEAVLDKSVNVPVAAFAESPRWHDVAAVEG
jgi:putative NIF3 family GTP cyclohydrolase 1 type 2